MHVTVGVILKADEKVGDKLSRFKNKYFDWSCYGTNGKKGFLTKDGKEIKRRIAVGDIDMEQTMPVGVLIKDGQWFEEEPPELNIENGEENAEAFMASLAVATKKWNEKVRELLSDCNPSDCIALFDVHM